MQTNIPNSDSQYSLARRLCDWYRQPLGRLLARAEYEKLDKAIEGLFGKQQLTIAAPWDYDYGKHGQVQYQYNLDLGTMRIHDIDMVGAAESLPVMTDSIDLLILPHILERSDDPHQVLREADRCLVSGGHLIVFGFNPFSLWGLWRKFYGWRGLAPWNKRFYSMFRIKDWLSLLGFDVLQEERMFHRPPINHAKIMNYLKLMEKIAWPLPTASYMLLAQKRDIGFTIIKPVWKRPSRVLSGGLAEPSVRGMLDE